MNNLHYDLEKHLSEIDSSFTIVEALGYLTGYASSNCSFDSYLQGLITYFSSDSNPSSDKINIELIKDNIELIKQDLENNSLVLFFNEEDDLSSKLASSKAKNDSIRFELVDKNTALEEIPKIYDIFRTCQNGATDRTQGYWNYMLYEDEQTMYNKSGNSGFFFVIAYKDNKPSTCS